MQIDIVACTDKWFVMPTGVMMYSVCVNNPDVGIVFHIIKDDSVTAQDEHDLEETVTAFKGKRVAFYTADDTLLSAFPNLQLRWDITKGSYYRLMLSEILPDTIHKVLYLDGDIIVRGSLLPLWNTDLASFAVAAIPDPMEGIIKYYNRLQYPLKYGYFNAGVLLVNLDYWRKHDAITQFNEFLKNRADDIRFHDQDVLNVIFCDSKQPLSIKYNLHNGFISKNKLYDYWKYEKELLETQKDPVVIHFSDWKPWYSYQRNPHPFSSTWFKYQNQTKWRGVKIDKRPFKLRVINYVADMLRKYGLKSPVSSLFDYIDIAPID